VAASEVVSSIQFCIVRWWVSVISFCKSLNEILEVDETYSETKLVRRDEDDDSPVLRRSSVPPTICLTFPSCKSIQGRNWDLRRGASAVVVMDIV
jgi:hypothetical protein